MDGILQTLDSYNTDSGSLDLTGNAEPSISGEAHANNLASRGWKVQSSEKNLPVAYLASIIGS